MRRGTAVRPYMRRTSLSFFALLVLAACHKTSDEGTNSSSAIADDGTSLTAAVSPARATGPSPWQALRPALATNGTGFLAAWSECRSPANGEYQCLIRAARIDALGKIIDDVNIDLPHSAGTFDDAPAIAFDGTNYLVVWSHKHDDGGDASPIQGARISPAGRVLDALPIEFGTHGGKPTVTSMGDGSSVVAWTELEAHEIHATLIATDGSRAVDDTMLTDVSDLNSPPTISIAGTKNQFLLAWENLATVQTYTEVHAVRLASESLGFLDPAPLDIAVNRAHHTAPQVTTDGTRFLVVFTDGLDGTGATGRFVETDGTMGDRVTLATSGKYARVGFDGDSYILASTAGVARFDRTTLSFDRFVEGPAVTTFEPAPALATMPHGTLVLQSTPSYGDFPDTFAASGSTPIAGVLYDEHLTPFSTPIRPARAPAIANHVVSAQNGDERLVVWHEYRSDWAHAEIRGAVVKADGTLLTNESFSIRGSDERGLTDPTIVFDGTSYVIAWNESIDGEPAGVGLARFDAKAHPIGEPEVRAGARDPHLFMAGKDVFVALKGGQVLKADIGFVYPDNRGLFTVEGPQMQTAVTYDGKDFVAAWLTPTTNGEITAKTRRYGADGKPVTGAISLATFYDNTPLVTLPRFNITAASDGKGKTVIAWDDETAHIQGAVVDRDAALPVVNLALPTGLGKRALAPALVYSGSEWLLAYSESSSIVVQRLQLATNLERSGNAKKLAGPLGMLPSLSTDGRGGALIGYTLDGAMTAQTYSYAPGSNPPPAGDDDDDHTSKPTPKPGDGTNDPSTNDPATSKAAEPAAPKSSVSVSAGCSTSSHGESNGFPLALLALGGVAAARRRRNHK